MNEEKPEPKIRKRSILDSDGNKVVAGDEIYFSYGIPPLRAVGIVTVIKGELWVLTPGHNPNKCRMSELREYVEHFWLSEKREDQP